MKEEFVSYEIAKKLREKGFKEQCVAHYYPSGSELFFNQTTFRGATVEDCLYSYNSLPVECIGSELIDAPTIAQILKWLRETKGLYVDISLCKKGYYAIVYETNFPDNKDYANSWYIYGLSETYEQTALDVIEYVLDNLI